MASHLLIVPLKICSGMKPVPSCEPSTNTPLADGHSHCAIGACIIDR